MIESLLSVLNNLAPEIRILFVFIPSSIALLAILYRLALFSRLRNLSNWTWATQSSSVNTSQAPRSVQLFKEAFEKVSEKLDDVNTLALIDHIYAREAVWGVPCEQIEFITKMLPNLLLSVGLFGTFIGVTQNLVGVTSALDQANSALNIQNIEEIIPILREPLTGMSIAFISSLVGLFWGVILTIVNALLNTTLAKHRFIVAVEYYLDNYLASEGKDSASRIINGISNSLNNFLERFGQTVRQAVQESLGAEVEKMVAANKEASNLAKEVNEKFLDASGNIVTGAETFRAATVALNDGQFSNKFNEATNKLLESQTRLESFTALLQEAISTSTSSSERSIALCDSLVTLEQQMSRVLEAVDNNQSDFNSIAMNLRQGSQDFLTVQNVISELIDQVSNVQSQVTEKSQALAEIENHLSNLVNIFDESQKQITTGQVNIKSSLDSMTQANHQVSDNLNQGAAEFSKISNILTQLTQQVNQLHENVSRTNSHVTNQFEKGKDNFAEISSGLKQLIQTIESLGKQVSENSSHVTNTIDQGVSNFSNVNEVLSELTNSVDSLNTQVNSRSNVLSDVQKELKRLIDSITKFTQQLTSEQSTISRHVANLEKQISALDKHIDNIVKQNSSIASHSEIIGNGLSTVGISLEKLNEQFSVKDKPVAP